MQKRTPGCEECGRFHSRRRSFNVSHQTERCWEFQKQDRAQQHQFRSSGRPNNSLQMRRDCICIVEVSKFPLAQWNSFHEESNRCQSFNLRSETMLELSIGTLVPSMHLGERGP